MGLKFVCNKKYKDQAALIYKRPFCLGQSANVLKVSEKLDGGHSMDIVYRKCFKLKLHVIG